MSNQLETHHAQAVGHVEPFQPAKPFVYREGDVVPPDVRKVFVHYSVRALPQKAFAGCRQLEEIELPEELEVIEANAFYDCRSLRIVNVPSSVVWIGAYAFAGCRSLRALPLVEGLRHIGKNAFLCCDVLERLDVPSSVDFIGSNVFYVCSALKEVTIKEGAITISEDAFRDCPSLERIRIPSPAFVVERAAGYYSKQDFDCRLVTSGSIDRYEAEGVSIISPDCLVYVPDLSEVQDEISAIVNRRGRRRGETGVYTDCADEQRREEDLAKIHRLIDRRASLEVSTILELALWKGRMGREGDLDARARTRCRVKCGADEVVPNVLSFL